VTAEGAEHVITSDLVKIEKKTVTEYGWFRTFAYLPYVFAD
jgi:hypothetical protein